MYKLKKMKNLDELKSAILEEYNYTKSENLEEDVIGEVVNNLTFYLDDTFAMYHILKQSHLISNLDAICDPNNFDSDSEENFMNEVSRVLTQLAYKLIEGPRLVKTVEDLIQSNPQSLEVVQTSEWYRESLDKCCSFEGHLKNQPEIEVEVIIGWKDPKTWKPIYKTHQNSLPGTIFKVHNDNPYRPFYSPSGTAILMNTDSIEILLDQELSSTPPLLSAEDHFSTQPNNVEPSPIEM